MIFYKEKKCSDSRVSFVRWWVIMGNTNRRADATLFGFDFQVNAAIVLFLENVKNVESLRLEGQEDIDLYLKDDSCILAQAKAVQRPREDFCNVKKNLCKSLQSLSEAAKSEIAKKYKVKELIFITNSPYPLKERFREVAISNYFPAQQNFFDLTETERETIQKELKKRNIELNTSILKIQILPFATDNERERYKFIKQELQDFLLRLHVNISDTVLLQLWQNDIFCSGTIHDESLVLEKKDIIWPMIVKMTDTDDIPQILADDLDESLTEEIIQGYHSIISAQSENFEFAIKVLSDYKKFFDNNRRKKEKYKKFIQLNWKKYVEDFSSENLNYDPELQETIIKVVLCKIIENRIRIKHIKEDVGL